MDDKILKLLGQKSYTPSNVPQLLDSLGLRPNQQQELQLAISRLEKKGLILRTKGNRYIQAREADLVPGVIQITRGGRGFLQPDEPGIPEIAIPESGTSIAMHGDRVLVRRDVKPALPGKPKPDENTGTVVRILERKRASLVGTLQRGKQFLFVIPDDPRISQHIIVPEPRDVGRQAQIGDKVVVEMVAWESRNSNPEGEVIEVLGAPDEEGVDMLSVLRHYDMPLHFPKEVLHEANTIAAEREKHESGAALGERVDCRDHLVITIDPDDAKDFDDAICLERMSQDRWRLWVHIADVSHYVKPGSHLDVEAKKRGNSTYLVDRVIPMLPEALSNELCSLKPNVDRLTKCVEFLLSSDGTVLQTKFYAALICSKRRFTYKEALATIEKPATNAIERMVHQAHEMAQNIRRARFKAGSLDLDFPESKIRLDESGKVLRIEKIENDVSHQLIEEYMLLANEAVATKLMKINRPAVYRVHESPKEKKLNEYRDQVLGHQIPCGNLNRRPEVQKLLRLLADLPIGPALKIGFLRSLMRARYAVEPLGHYGLSKTKYTHFTSPIRRYADLVVHRVLFDNALITPKELKDIADHITGTERNSSDAERDSKEVKMYAYLKAQIKSGKLEAYPAMVTDVRNFGFFVEVNDLGMSGLVHLSSVPDDFFIFDPMRNQLYGKHSRRIIKLGDIVTVNVYTVDSFKKQVDFTLVDKAGGAGGEHPRKAGPPRQDRGREPQRRDRGSDKGRPKGGEKPRGNRDRRPSPDRGKSKDKPKGPPPKKRGA